MSHLARDPHSGIGSKATAVGRRHEKVCTLDHLTEASA
jgi:hypothetical protein